MLDPDFGWHLAMGKLILESGIPKTDPFSYTMPSFPFVDHEWASNVFMYFIYSHFGKWPLAVFYSGLAIAALLIVIPKKLFKYSLLPLIFSLILVSHFINIRPQNETWLLFSVLVVVLFNDQLWQKFKWLVPFIFLIWANLHAGFALGLVVLVYSVLFGLIKREPIPKADLTVLGMSVLATLINPYGWRLYEEVLRQISDTSLHSSIQEWRPLYAQFDPVLIFILAFSFVFVYKFWQEISLKERLSYLFLLLLAISGLRHLPFFVIFNLKILSFCLYKFANLANTTQTSQLRANTFKTITLLLALEILILTLSDSIKQAEFNSEANSYPEKAVTYITDHYIQGRLFTTYEWGGYLIWKLPEKKVFIDGRMPSWRRYSAPPGESTWAFKEYRSALYSGKLNETLAKYHVSVVLLPKNKNPFFLSFPMPFINLFLSLKTSSVPPIHLDSAWKVIYQDKIAIIYQRMKHD